MKKILLLLILLTIPSTSFATSGTCSYHGGVNCYAGSDWDGSAICNDGWRDSSELFLSVIMCNKQKYYCNNDEWLSISAKYNLDAQQNKITELSQKNANSYISSSAGETSSFAGGEEQRISRINAINSINSANEIIILQNKWNNDFNAAQFECETIGSDKYYRALVEVYKRQEGNNNYNVETQVTQPSVITTTRQNLSCPNNSEVINGKCQCNKNSTFDGSNCIYKKSDNKILDTAPAIIKKETKVVEEKLVPNYENSIIKKISRNESLFDTEITATSSIKIEVNKLQEEKRWYNWLNPFSWFK